MVVELVVDRIVAGGAGIAEHDGRKVFVPYSAPGDVLELEIERLGVLRQTVAGPQED